MNEEGTILKVYCRLALTIVEFEQTDIIVTSNGQFAAFDANDVMGDDPGFWEVMLP